MVKEGDVTPCCCCCFMSSMLFVVCLVQLFIPEVVESVCVDSSTQFKSIVGESKKY